MFQWKATWVSDLNDVQCHKVVTTKQNMVVAPDVTSGLGIVWCAPFLVLAQVVVC